MRRILTFLVIAISLLSCEEKEKENDSAPVDHGFNGYYSTVTNQTGAELKEVLYNIVKGHTAIKYTYSSGDMDVWRALEKTDEDPANPDNVILIYTGKSIPKTSKAKNNQSDYWNREHVWAKSRGDFGTSTGAGTDIHHLRPCDATVNSARSNKAFDNGGVAHREATLCKTDSDSWEPRDAVKGDIARMMFYMATRYEGKDPSDYDSKDLILVNTVIDDKSGKHGVLSALLKWHEADPVDEFERKRNNTIQSIQKNRNPFIDHPEWAAKIWN